MTEISIGSSVNVIRGVFKDFQGVVSHFNNDNIVVELDIFERKISVTLHLDDLDIENISPLDIVICLMIILN